MRPSRERPRGPVAHVGPDDQDVERLDFKRVREQDPQIVITLDVGLAADGVHSQDLLFLNSELPY